jgi:hypothetical protein
MCGMRHYSHCQTNFFVTKENAKKCSASIHIRTHTLHTRITHAHTHTHTPTSVIYKYTRIQQILLENGAFNAESIHTVTIY